MTTTNPNPQALLDGAIASLHNVQQVISDGASGKVPVTQGELDDITNRAIPVIQAVTALAQAQAIIGVANLLEDIRDSLQIMVSRSER